MRELIVRDDRELRRVERAIAAIAQNKGMLSRHCLLAALYAERNNLLRELGRGRPCNLHRSGSGEGR